MIALGEPGLLLADTVEQPVLLVESAPLSGKFEPAPYLGNNFRVRLGANDNLPTAQIDINIAGVFGLEDPPGGPPAELRDWQARGPSAEALQPDVFFLAGRRVSIQTARQNPELDWIIFEGFVEKAEFGFTGSKQQGARSLTLFCTDTAVAADRELSQQMGGQWRRSYTADLYRLMGDIHDPRTLVCVRTAAPLIFNPGGKPNCCPAPLVFPDASKVYIPTDPEDPDAIPWTVAKALRYIQWAALQPAPSWGPGCDVIYQSRPDGVKANAKAWTSFSLRHANLNELLEAKLGETMILDLAPDTGAGPAGRAGLLRAIPDLALEGMTTLEAFAYLCDRAGMMMDVFHEPTDPWHGAREDPNQDDGGEGEPEFIGLTLVKFSLRGHRMPREDPLSNGSLTHGAWLRIPSDKSTDPSATEAQLIATSDATEGALLLDDSGRRAAIRVQGEPTQYEMTVELRPGWKPNDWWDIDPDDPAAVQAAIDRTATAEWEARHVAGIGSEENLIYRRIGRLWVLNEHGGFTNRGYERTYGPWAGTTAWKPYNFRTQANVRDLAKRGQDGWSLARRRFVDPLALTAGEPIEIPEGDRVGLFVELSFDAGATWSHLIGGQKFVSGDQCAITLMSPDLREIFGRDANNNPTADNFVTAYIRGLLRVRITAQIAGDDAVYGYAPPDPTHGRMVLPWAELVDRHEQFRRDLRGHTFANDVLTSAYHLGYPFVRDDSAQALAAATRLRNELQARRCSGHVTIPYLLRPRMDYAWETYAVGDEILGVETGVGATKLDFEVGGRAPRVVAVEYRWSRDPAEASTTLTLEDHVYGPDDVMAGKVAGDPWAEAANWGVL